MLLLCATLATSFASLIDRNLPEMISLASGGVVAGGRFGDTFNPRRAVMSDRCRVGYMKLLSDQNPVDPWSEQWANEEVAANLAEALGIPTVEARAAEIDGELGAVVVFMEGRKLSELHLTGFQERPIIEGAVNRNQLGLIVAFDFWIMNADRGAHNVFITFPDGRPRIAVIDHGHSLLLPRSDKVGDHGPENWLEYVVSGHLEREDLSQRLRQGHLVQYVTPQEVMAGARAIAGLTDDTIDSAVQGIDERFFCCHPEAIGTLLKHRRDRLEQCLGEVL